MEHGAKRRVGSSRDGRRLLIVGAVLAVSLLWSLLAYHLSEKRTADLAQAKRDATNITIALAEQVSRLIESVDQLLRMMQVDHDRDPSHFSLAGWIARSESLRAVANQVASFDEHGDLVEAMRAPPPGRRINIADRPAFTYLASHPDAGLYIGRTYRSRLQQAMVIPLVRRLSGPNGAFAGTVSISIDPDYLMRQFGALDVGLGGSVALYGRDGFMRASTPAIADMVDRSLRSPWQHDEGSAPSGAKNDGRGTSSIDRIDATRDVPGQPLTIEVGLSRDDVLGSWRAEAMRALAFGIGASVILLVLANLLLREQVRREGRETALRSSRDALAEAESGFRNIFDSLPETLVLLRIGVDGSITVDALNGEAVAFFGIRNTIVGKEIEALRADAAVPGLPERIAEVAAHGQVVRYLDAVARSEERFRLLAEAAGDMISHLDPYTLRREYVSPGCCRLLGFKPEELMHRRPIEDVHPDDVARLQAVAVRLTSSEGPDETIATYRTRHKAGHWLWVEGRLNLARDKSGAPVAMVCSVRDVTERHDAEAAVKASESRFRLLAENTSELIVLGRRGGALTYISPASRRLFGYAPDELADEMASQRWAHPEDRERLVRAMLASGSTTSAVCRVRHRNGDWVWVEAIVRSFAANADEPTIIATFRDVSERVAQAQVLQRAKEAAEQASLAKSDFLAAMSHEIRTPLNAVLGYADLLLRDGGLTDRQRLNLARIENAGSALRTVVDDVLDFSKIEAGEIDVARQAFRPHDLIDNALSIMRGAAQAKGLDLVVDLGTAVPTTVIGDHDRLRQVLLNLLNNAVKFTPEGAITLSVTVPARDAAMARLRFCIADTGIGISKAGLERLFQRFSQVDGSISREFGGTGLGLAICRRLVEAMGGTVGVESEVGRGSMFWFDVPLALSAAGAVERGGGEPMRQARALDVLLVEDQPLNRDLARAVLEAAGHRVAEVADGAAAVAAVLGHPYDVVLMDVQMPVMDGIEATRRIRSLPHAVRHVPIVAMTANVLPAQVADLRKAGMDDHVGKPFRREELLAVIARAASQDAPVTVEEPSRQVFDLAAYKELEAVIGSPTIRRIAVETLAQAAAMLSCADHSRYATQAHAILGTAGTVGLRELASDLMSLERACLASVAPAPLLAKVAGSLARASAALEAAAISLSAA